MAIIWVFGRCCCHAPDAGGSLDRIGLAAGSGEGASCRSASAVGIPGVLARRGSRCRGVDSGRFGIEPGLVEFQHPKGQQQQDSDGGSDLGSAPHHRHAEAEGLESRSLATAMSASGVRIQDEGPTGAVGAVPKSRLGPKGGLRRLARPAARAAGISRQHHGSAVPVGTAHQVGAGMDETHAGPAESLRISR